MIFLAINYSLVKKIPYILVLTFYFPLSVYRALLLKDIILVQKWTFSFLYSQKWNKNDFLFIFSDVHLFYATMIWTGTESIIACKSEKVKKPKMYTEMYFESYKMRKYSFYAFKTFENFEVVTCKWRKRENHQNFKHNINIYWQCYFDLILQIN